MPPLIPRRRRRRSSSGRAVLLVAALIVTAVLIGGYTRISRQSGPYEVSINRSFGAQGAAVARESSATGTTLRRLWPKLGGQDRQTLEADLDAIVAQAEAQSARAAALQTPKATGAAQATFASVFAQRATAVSEVRAALDGLLGMHPLPVPGAAGQSGTVAATPTLLSSTAATNRIAGAGALLVRADREYRGVRHALATAPGHAKLPASTWVTNPQVWQIGSVATQVDLASSSTSLAVTHKIVLRSVRLTPAALPAATTPPPTGTSVLSPTSTVSVTVVISNLGSVAEPHAAVQFTLSPQPSGVTASVTRRVALAAGTSVTLTSVTFKVTPGHSYQLNVAIVPPEGQADAAGPPVTQILTIAPAT